MNLVLNARDAAEAAGGRVVVTLSVESRCAREWDWRPDRVGPGEYVVVSVVDGGGGIPEQVRERIFEPFFSTKEGANSGPGPADRARGRRAARRWRRDPRGGGRRRAGHPDGALAPGRARPPAELRRCVDRRSVRMLLIDDDDDVRRSTRHLLEGMGHSVVDVRSASGALAVIEGGDPVDLVLSDVRMPGTSGPELVRRLRSLVPDLPVLFVTGLRRRPRRRGRTCATCRSWSSPTAWRTSPR